MTLEARVGALEKKDRVRALNERISHLRADGYNGTCHNSGTARAVTRDACPNCERQSLRYLGGVIALKPYSQIEFVQCSKCGYWSEDV